MKRRLATSGLKGDRGTVAFDDFTAQRFEHRLDERPFEITVNRIGPDTVERSTMLVVHTANDSTLSKLCKHVAARIALPALQT